MARFVMISIPDNKEADAFVAALQDGYVMYSKPHPTLENEVSINKPETEWQAVALWADPTKLCECHPPWKLPNAKEPAVGLQCNAARSVNYGWLVCMQCNKPHPHQYQHPKNLLAPDETPSTRTYVLGFKADRSKKDGTAPGS
jgi:hypothetical protein